MTYFIIAIAVVVVVVGAVYTIMRNNKIKANGIEVDAEISRIETDRETDNDGHTTTTETYYVKYRNAEGQTVEAKLGNPPAHAFVGTKLRVKYLPEKPKYVIQVK